ncbi:MAG: hypothetical protein PSV16_05020 [Flavobacterium sp.]|nr:hypothetical protein [Flavobacterium sp.]
MPQLQKALDVGGNNVAGSTFMLNEKLLYQTKLGTKQYIRAFLKLWITIVPGTFLLVRTFYVKTLFIPILIIVCFATIFLYLRALKTFKIFSNNIIVKRTFLKPEIFPIKEINKIIFTSESRGKVNLFYMRIESQNSKNEFSLIYFGKQLQDFIKQLKINGIEVENDLINH